jgi:iron complex outermembrane receptor protein
MRPRSFWLFILLSSIAWGQQENDTLRFEVLEAVEIRATRLVNNALRTPYGVSVVDLKDNQESQRQLTLQEYLNAIPGLYASNGYNFAQDLRISLRGFGARSAFGIRGIKLLVDGIPETTPDGQGQVDNLDLGGIQRIEVIKGPMSALYGNASGGVISFYTSDVQSPSATEIGVGTGSYGFLKADLRSNFKLGESSLSLGANATRSEGFRDQSKHKSSSIFLKANRHLSDKHRLTLSFNVTDSPYAWDPGGLTLQEVKMDRTQARQRNIDYATREKISHVKSGISHQYNRNNNQLNSYAFLSGRKFEGLLPFEFGGWVELDRTYYGLGTRYGWSHSKKKFNYKLLTGIELAGQNDDRERFLNLNGEKGNKTLGQMEAFHTLGIYSLHRFSWKDVDITTGLRYDQNRLKATDRFLDNGDQSGKRDYDNWSPTLGISLAINAHTRVYSSLGSSFETPVLSELSANPSGQAGFNPDLKPQRSESIEFGFKHRSAKGRIELSLFKMNTSNEVLPFELEAYQGRTFYRNSGRSQRTGIEFFMKHYMSNTVSVNGGFTYSYFKFKDYAYDGDVFDGNLLPGIPKHNGFINVNFQPASGLKAALHLQYRGELFADDANTVVDPDQFLVHVRMSKAFQWNKVVLIPFAGIDNLFDRSYNDNIRINAFGGRYFEPAPGLFLYGGLRLRSR